MMRVDEFPMRPPDQPVAPLFLLDADRDWIEFEEIVTTERILLSSAAIKEYEFIAYAADGTKTFHRLFHSGPVPSRSGVCI